MEGSWILFCIQSVLYTVLIEVCEENLASHRYVFGKGRGVLIGFLKNCVCSSLIIYQNSPSDSFLKVSCNVESETMPVDFWCTVTLKSFGLESSLQKNSE